MPAELSTSTMLAASAPCTSTIGTVLRPKSASSSKATLSLLAFIALPLVASDYALRAILIPFLILALAALGLNILVGYCGQISLGTGAFMAVGAYAAYNFMVRIDGMPLLVAVRSVGIRAKLFNLPEDYIFGAAMALGYLGEPSALPNENFISQETAPRQRKPLSEFVLSDWGVPAKLG